MQIHHDPDEWVTVCKSDRHGGSIALERRPADEVKRIKAERRQREEDEILRRADEIRASRAPLSDRMNVGEV